MNSERRPIVESFRISGLHGYKDVEIDFRGPARIVIAENGAGKTTILSAIHSFLLGDFDRFRNLSFESIECRFGSLRKTVVLKRTQIPELPDTGQGTLAERLAEWARYANAEPQDVRRAVLQLDMYRIDVRSDPVLEAVYYQSPLDIPSMVEQLRVLRSELDQLFSDELKVLAEEVKGAVSPHQILYLPTYRRVELAIGKSELQRGIRRVPIQPQAVLPSRQFQQRRLNNYGIQFGLSDVADRLNEILTTIQRDSNQGYRIISAGIIDELLEIKRSSASAAAAVALPDIATLSLFFSRIANPGSAKRLTALKALYDNGEIHSPEHETLRYFLTRLSRVVDKTKELEASIEQFVEKVNDYLQTSSDEKSLVYDPVRMKVVVENLYTEEKVKLDDLSSGEKQVVSILSYLYLDPGKKIILIDEPELSLSMDWQKRLLPDVVASPTCAQLLAITHSPFIFDNELDPYAGPLRIQRRRRKDA